MKDFYTEMKMVDLIERQPIYKSKLLMEHVPGARLPYGSDVYFIPVTVGRIQDPLFSFLKDRECVMMGVVVDVAGNKPNGSSVYIDNRGHLVTKDQMSKLIGETICTKPLSYFYENCPKALRTDGTDIYVEDNGLIIKVSYILLCFKDHTDDVRKTWEYEYVEVFKTAEPKDLLNALIVHYNDVYDCNMRKIEQTMWETINIAATRDTLRQVQVQGTYYPECSTICRKEGNM